jgi:simple sugar transport system substrate-binding protein
MEVNMKRFLVVLLVLAVAASVFAGGRRGAESGIPVGIVNLHPSESGYREANVLDMARVFSTANGYRVLNANVNTLNEQLAAANQFINEGVKYLLISAADTDGWDSVLASAKRAGIKVFKFDRTINTSPDNYEAAVVSDMWAQGRRAVAWLEAQNRPGGYRFIHINGQMGSAPQRGRSEPLNEAIAKHPNWTLVRTGTGGDTWSADEAKRIVEAAIAARENFNTIYAHNDGMAQGAMAALREAGISHGVNGDVWIIGYDFNRFALRHVMAGEWNLDVQSSPRQADVIHGFIQDLEAGRRPNIPANKTVILDEIVADRTNVDQAFIAQFGIGE